MHRSIPKSICGQEDCPTPYEFCEACVRTDEGEVIAQAIEAERDLYERLDYEVQNFTDAARIARNGGRDE